VLMRFDASVYIEYVEISNLSIRGIYYDPTDSSGVGLITDPQVGGADYDMHIGVVDQWDNRDTINASVKGDGTRDRRAPEVLKISPEFNAPQVVPDVLIHMMFSDAMQSDEVSDFWMASDSTFAPKGSFEWAALNHLVFTPSMSWPAGTEVHLLGRGDHLVDVGGNTLSDPISIRFSVMDTAALGHIDGTTSRPDMVVWAQHLDLDIFIEQAVQDTTFTLMDLVPGMYRIWGFWDRDQNGQWTSGQISPFVPAEPLVSRADTVDVRTRWQTEIGRLETEAWWTMPAVLEDY